MQAAKFAHDAGVVAWITVIAYMATAVLCALAARRADASLTPTKGLTLGERPFWVAATVVFVLLGLNKQLDLQTLATQLARASARADGWYAHRRIYQAEFVALLAACATFSTLFLLWLVRFSRFSVKLAAMGGIVTSAFIVLRAASFHHTDVLLSRNVGMMRWNWIIELTGIFLVAAAAISYRPGRSRHHDGPGAAD